MQCTHRFLEDVNDMNERPMANETKTLALKMHAHPGEHMHRHKPNQCTHTHSSMSNPAKHTTATGRHQCSGGKQ